MKRKVVLTNAERLLLAVLVDVVSVAAFLALCIADKIQATTAAAAIAGIVLARKPPYDVNNDDDDDPPTSTRRRRKLGAVSGLLTMLVGVLWIVDRVRAKVGA